VYEYVLEEKKPSSSRSGQGTSEYNTVKNMRGTRKREKIAKKKKESK
jgi:hypothetical protein